MKNFFKAYFAPVIGVIATAVIIFSMAACGDGGDDSINGIWIADGEQITLKSDGSFEIAQNNTPFAKGNYTTSARSISANISLAINEIHGDIINKSLNDPEIDINFESKWYNKTQFKDELKKWVKDINPSVTDDQISAVLDDFFKIYKGTIDGDTMTIGDTTYTKEGSKGGGSGGTLTITGIPSQYNGKYAVYYTNWRDRFECDSLLKDDLVGCQKVGTFPHFVQISNGSVKLPMWIKIDDGVSWVRYSGNKTIADSSYLEIFEKQVYYISASSLLDPPRCWRNTIFKNGSATLTWSSGSEY